MMHKLNGRFLAPMTFAVVLFVGIISYQSMFGIQPPPAEFSQTVGSAVSDETQTLIQYSRNIHIRTHIRVMLDRTIDCGKENMTYDFPTSYREADAGDYSFDGRLMMPFKVQPGTDCVLHTMVRYQPTFSLRTHSYYAPDLHLTIAVKHP
jgi:hypothetical protein